MIEFESRFFQAAHFLESDTARTLTGWDGEMALAEPTAVDMYCRLHWADTGRATRAWDLIDREIRRCGRASSSARGELQLTSADQRHHRFSRELADFPRPVSSASDGLALEAAFGPPLTLHLSPQGGSGDALAYAPALTIGYALSTFGIFSLWRFRDSGGDAPKGVEDVVDFLKESRLEDGPAGPGYVRADDLHFGTRRAVSRASDTSADLDLVLVRDGNVGMDWYYARI